MFLPLLLVATASAQEPVRGDAARLGAWRMRLDAAADAPHSDLVWRAIGPRFCGGRIEDVECPPGKPGVIYCGVGAGGVWKSVNGGLTWEAIFTDQPTFAIGDLELSAADPELLWVGTGEAHLSGTSYEGVGIFKSEDGGATFTHVGLSASAHIGKLVSHPTERDTLFVAAIGSKHDGSGGERGVYRTTDGGASWERVLEAGASVAFIDLVIDPSDPTRLWAASWDRSRQERSGVWRTTDGGDTWERLEGGLQETQVGRVAIDASASEPGVVYALLVDHSPEGDGRSGVTGAVYRSGDGGDSWAKTHEEKLPTYVGWDFCDVRVAPDDANEVYVCGLRLLRSEDGGKSWERGGERVQRLHAHRGSGMHLDMHDVWIDPEHPDRLLLGTDGGLYVSWDRARSYLHLNDLPITEFYKLHLTGAEVCEVWGGTQDNASLVTASTEAYTHGSADPWEHLWLDPWAGGDGFATFPDPFDPTILYWTQQLGDLKRGTRGELFRARRIRPRGRDLEFAWDTPLIASTQTEGLLYCAAQQVHRSTDRGDSWEAIGPEPWGGAILSMSLSPTDPQLLMTGASSGWVQYTLDGGETWQRAAELPGARIRDVLLSQHEPDHSYVVQSGSSGGDWQSYLHRSSDHGQTWTSIQGDLPAEPCNAIAEDPRDAQVLYVGTDLGVWFTQDGGQHWFPLGCELPSCPVLDLEVHAPTNTLVIVTHGLSAFALDVASVVP